MIAYICTCNYDFCSLVHHRATLPHMTRKVTQNTRHTFFACERGFGHGTMQSDDGAICLMFIFWCNFSLLTSCSKVIYAQFVSTHLYPFLFSGAGVRFSLRGTTYQNNSLVALENIGDSSTFALLCMTDLAACCRTPAIGNWFFPNGTTVPNFSFQINNQPTLMVWEFYRNRGPSVVRMVRRRGGVDGIYRCEIPVSAGPPIVYQNIYIGVYATNSGE